MPTRDVPLYQYYFLFLVAMQKGTFKWPEQINDCFALPDSMQDTSMFPNMQTPQVVMAILKQSKKQ